MSAIGKGDWVECIDATPHPWHPELTLVLGRIYYVRAIASVFDWSTDTYRDGLLLADVSSDPHAYNPARFRPLGTREPLRQPAPAVDLVGV